VATQHLQNNTDEFPPAMTQEELKTAFDQLADGGKVTVREDSRPKSNKRRKPRKTSVSGGAQNQKVVRWLRPAPSENKDDQQQEPENEFSPQQLERIGQLDNIRMERQKRYSDLLERIGPGTPMDWLVNKQVADNIRHLLSQPNHVSKDVDWAIGFIESNLQHGSKLMLLLERWHKKSSRSKVTQSQKKEKTPKDYDFSQLNNRWQALRDNCGAHIGDIQEDMSGVNPTYASLLRNGPKKQFDFAVKKYNQSPKNAYYYIKHMLDWLEWALKYYLECQEGRTLRQLQKLDQQRQVSLSKNGLTQRNEVAVVYRVVLFDEIGQQYREELGASPRETLSFLRERLVMAMKAVGESGSSRQPLNASRPSDSATRPAHRIPEFVGEAVVQPVFLGKGIQIGDPNPQGPQRTKRGTVDGIGGGGSSKKVRQGKKNSKTDS
jgi:hypothetical protein